MMYKLDEIKNEGRLILTDYGWLDTLTGIMYATEEEFYETIKED